MRECSEMAADVVSGMCKTACGRGRASWMDSVPCRRKSDLHSNVRLFPLTPTYPAVLIK